MANNPLITAKQSIIDFLVSQFPEATISLADFSTPPNPELGDLAFGCFVLAKAAKLAPGKIAADLATTFKSTDIITKAIAAGPYINFFLNHEAVIAVVTSTTEPAIAPGPTAGTKAMVEYVSPNNNKPLHLGHVRNGVIGEAVSNLLVARGTNVIRALLLNDRGMAIAKAMVSYKRWGNGATPESLGIKSDHYLGDLYVQYDQAEKAGDKTLEDEAHDMIVKWEANDPEIRALWHTLSDWCEAGQHATYNRLGFHFDVEYKESDIYQGGKDIVELGLAKGVFTKDDTGAVVAKLEETHGLPDKVVLRADGTSLYITQDLYLAKKKFDDHGLDASIYVVGNEQNLHFKQLFKILELLGYPWASKLQHLSYGYVTLPEGRMKSREGTVVDADDLLTALEDGAATEIRQRYPDLADEAVGVRAHQVAIAAIKFHFLEVDIVSDSVFDPKESLSFNGRTGPYVQYMHARIASILRKAESSPATEISQEGIVDHEFQLALTIAEYPEAIAKAADQLRPSLVALHIYTIAKSVAAFYEAVPVVSAASADRIRRLKLLTAAGNSLRHGLNLLGIDAPNEM